MVILKLLLNQQFIIRIKTDTVSTRQTNTTDMDVPATPVCNTDESTPTISGSQQRRSGRYRHGRTG
jgi:hypothetical protein